jgi:hypothetical protein
MRSRFGGSAFLCRCASRAGRLQHGRLGGLCAQLSLWVHQMSPGLSSQEATTGTSLAAGPKDRGYTYTLHIPVRWCYTSCGPPPVRSSAAEGHGGQPPSSILFASGLAYSRALRRLAVRYPARASCLCRMNEGVASTSRRMPFWYQGSEKASEKAMLSIIQLPIGFPL